MLGAAVDGDSSEGSMSCIPLDELPVATPGTERAPHDDNGTEEVPAVLADFNSWVEYYRPKAWQARSLFPPLSWFPAYVRCIRGLGRKEDLVAVGALPYSLSGDCIAGLTVGCMLVPQCLAFALLAGLPVQIGLFASFVPLVAYALTGTIRQVQPGPTALMSLITGQALDQLGLAEDRDRVAAAAFLALLAGGMSVALGAARLGVLVDFMSHSVMSAFCTAAGITIGTSQLRHILGVTIPRTKYWWQTVLELVSHVGDTDAPTLVLGLTLLSMLLFLKYWKAAGGGDARRRSVIWRWFPREKTSLGFRCLKSVADLSPLLSVVIGWFWGRAYLAAGVDTVKEVGDVDGGQLHFLLPGADMPDVHADCLVPAAIMAVVGFLETIAVGGKFATAARYEYDANQELIALGLSNIGGAFMSGYPTTGSFSRTAVNATFGATSLVACFISSLVVLLAILLILPLIARLPLAALAPIIIQGAVGVVSFREFDTIRRVSLREFCVMLVTLVVCLLLTVKEGLLAGFVCSVASILYELANPDFVVCGRCPDGSLHDVRTHPDASPLPGVCVLRMDARLSFANARKLQEFCARVVRVNELQERAVEFVVLDGKAINSIDATGLEALENLAVSLESCGQRLIVANLKSRTSRLVMSTDLPVQLRKHGGAVCSSIKAALDIADGVDRQGSKALKRVASLSNKFDAALAWQGSVCGSVPKQWTTKVVAVAP